MLFRAPVQVLHLLLKQEVETQTAQFEPQFPDFVLPGGVGFDDINSPF